MKQQLICMLAFVLASLTGFGQLVGVDVEAFYTDDATVVGYPVGHTTYRVYGLLADDSDALTAVFGAGDDVLELGTTGTHWNSGFGGVVGPELNAAFFAFFPSSEYDSVVTIGRANSAVPGSSITAVASSPSSTVIAEAFGTAAAGIDEQDGNLIINDGTWFSTPDGVNCYGTGADFRVLLAQVTTAADLMFNLNVQVIDGGIGGTPLEYVWNPSSAAGQVAAPFLQYPAAGVDGCMDATACNYNDAATNDDGSCVYATGCDTCSGETDGSGVVVDNPEPGDACDDGDATTMDDTVQADCSCAGVLIVEGCTDMAACNYDPAANVDNGSCTFPGCNDDTACNYDPAAGCDDGSCDFSCYGCTDATACNYDPSATIDDGSCDLPNGCTDAGACNYDAAATCDDGSCEFDSCAGCTDATACNYDATATIEDGSCEFDSCAGCTDAGACNYDATATIEDGSCEYDSCAGCTDSTACNYDSTATIEDGSCDFSCYGCTDQAACNYDMTATIEDGSCEYDSCAGCTDATACNYDATATLEDGSCEYDSCAGCTDATACNYDDTATIDDGSCEFDSCAGCTDPTACNYDPTATTTGTSIETYTENFDGMFAPELFVDQDTPTNDYFTSPYLSMTNGTWEVLDISTFNCAALTEPNSLVWNPSGCTGCPTSFATLSFSQPAHNVNFWLADDVNLSVTVNHAGGSTDYSFYGNGDTGNFVELTETGITSLDFDTDHYGCIDEFSYSVGADVCVYPGCTDATACNYNDAAGCDDGSCDFSCYGCTDQAACNFDIDATIDDGSCDFDSCLGCTDMAACNYDDAATIDDGSCTYPGCNDDTACNYEDTAGCDDGSCVYPEPGFDCDGNCIEVPANDLCENATPITCGESISGTTACATDIGFPGSCSEDWSANGLGVWFSFVGNGEPILLSLCDEVYTFDTHIVLFNGECGDLNCIDGNDDWGNEVSDVEGDLGLDLPTDCGSSLQSVLINNSEAGEMYYVYVTGYEFADPAGGEFDFTLICSDAGDCQLEACAEDVTVECGDSTEPADTGMPTLTGTACEGEWSYTDVIDGDDCLYTITRSWVYTEVTGAVLFSCEQVITVQDTTAPEFDMLPEDVLVSCLEEVPAPEMLTATDACNGADVEIFGSETGNIVETCELTFADGQGDDWAVWLPGLVGDGIAPTAYWYFDGNGLMEIYDDNTANITGTLYNTGDNSLIVELDLWLEGAYDWATWNGDMGRLAKDTYDTGNFPDWIYYDVVDNFSTITGVAGIDGTLVMSHFPASHLFGFQCGEGANDRNGNNGIGGWFWYEGTVNGQAVEGQGDVNADKDCVTIPESDCPHNDEFTYFYRAFDDCGNQVIVEQIITVLDEIAPEFTEVPADVTVECDALDTLPNPEDVTVTATDNCEGEVTIEYLGQFEGDGDECVYTLLRRWRATDLCGNSADHIQTITVVDTTAPVFDYVPADLTVECGDPIPSDDATATDNCQDVTITMEEVITTGGSGSGTTSFDGCTADFYAELDLPSFGEPRIFESLGQTIGAGAELDLDDEVQNPSGWTGAIGVDLDGNTLTVFVNETFSFGWADFEEVIVSVSNISCPGISNVEIVSDNLIDLDEQTAPYELNVEFTDNSITITWTNTSPGDIIYIEEGGEGIFGINASIACIPDNVITRTWTAADGCGNESTATQVITIVDTIAPELTVGADATIECDEEVPAAEYEATDACDSDVMVDISEEIVDGNCPQEYTLIRTYVATDDCGNSTTAVQTITVQDTTAPVVVAADDVTIECDEEVPAPDYTVSDNCDSAPVVEVTAVTVDGDCPQEYVMTRTYTATDACGNVSSDTQVITVQDTTAPVVVAADDVTIECDEEVPAPSYDVSDNCDSAPVVEVTAVTVDGACPQEYVMTRTYTATDACGNVSSDTQVITVVDTTAPIVVAADDVTIECDEEVPAPSYDVSDNCDSAPVVEVTAVTVDGECPQEYVMTRTYTATDACGNVSTDTQVITVQDTTAPVVVAADDVTIECDEEVPAPDYTVSDNCDDDVTVEVTADIADGDCPQEYVMTRTYTATDDCGNVSTATQVITVVDTTAPVFLPYEIAISVDCNEVDNLGALPAEDNCGEVTVTWTETLMSGGCLGTLERIYTAVDECGNEATATQYITITDFIAPTIENPADMTVECSEVDGIMDPADVEIYDNCDGELDIQFTETITDGDCENEYTITWYWMVTDYCENVSEATTVITVVDTTKPTWSFVPQDDEASCDDVPGVVMPTAVDNCDDDVQVMMIGNDVTPGACTGEYTITYTFIAVDNCGNESDPASYTVFVYDNAAPIFTFVPGPVTYECDETIAVDMATAVDNCGTVEVTYEDNITDGDCPQEYTIERVFTATDDCGNAATASQIITVQDTTAPVIDAEPAVEVPCDQVDGIFITATDNCGEVTITYVDQEVSGGCFQNYIRTYTATDECGNSSTYEQVVIAVDEVAPVATYVPADASYECDEQILLEDATFEDNCDDELDITYGEEFIAGDCPQAYTLIRTWTASDDCDNSITVTQTISVDDTTAPVFEFVQEDMTLECDEEIPAPAAEVSDNCDSTVDWTVSAQIIDGACPQAYTMIRTYMAVDACGNMATAVQTITVEDTTAPELEVAADVTIECDQEVPAPAYEVSDNCDDDVTVEVTADVVDGECPQEYVMTRTYTATDDCGNVTTGTQVITVVDTTAPVFDYVPADLTVECGDPIPSDDATATDNCGDVDVTMEEVITTGGSGSGATSFDGCTADFYAELDLPSFGEPRIFESLGQTIGAGAELDLDDEVQNPSGWTGAIGVDLDGSTLTVFVNETFDFGWADFEEVIVSVSNISCPGISNVEVVSDNLIDLDEQTAPYELNVEFTDNSITITWTNTSPGDIIYIEEGGEGIFGINASISCIPDNVITRTWTATDECGNSETATQVITIVDTIAPELTVGADATIECDEEVPAAEYEAIDACDSDVMVEITEEIIDGDCPQAYTLVRTYVATDDCGNSTTAVQTIVVQDTTAPAVLFAPEDVTIECDEDEPTDAPIFEDNCDEELDMTAISGIVQVDDCTYLIEKAWTATDDCGNATTVSQVITVVDTTAPVFTSVPADATYECDEIIPEINAEATDNCTEVTVTWEDVLNPGSCPNSYVIVRTFTASDVCGNTATASQTITVLDTTNPWFTFVPEDANYECDEEVILEAPTAMDNCSDVIITPTEEMIPGACPQAYTLIRTWVATDACGNEATASQTITVVDTTAPVFTFVPADVTLECSDMVPTDNAEATDNCGAVTVTYTDEVDNTDCASEYTIVRYFTAVDECGNEAYAQQVITVQDTTAPELSDLPADIVLDCEDEVPAAPVLTASDLCDGDVDVVFEEELSGDVPPTGSESHCNALDPINQIDPLWSLVLFNTPEGTQYFTTIDVSWTTYPDMGDGKTAVLQGTVVSGSNPDAGFEIYAEFENGVDWATWDALGVNGYKDDWGVADDFYMDWTYYIMASDIATLTGWGDLAGTNLDLNHAPSSEYYAFQEGMGASNTDQNGNASYGIGGWFSWNGPWMNADTGVEVDQTNGNGDFGFTLECCPDYTITWTWTATDCAGNVTTHTMTVTFDDLDGTDDGNLTVGCMGDFNVDGSRTTTDLLMLLGDWNCQGPDCGCDIDGDEHVLTNDMLLLLGVFNTDCE